MCLHIGDWSNYRRKGFGVTYCCDTFKEHAEREPRDTGAFCFDPEDELWGINSCCGTYCWVISGMKFCPFCGKRIEDPEKMEGEKDNDILLQKIRG
jgi:hypothetical protein